MMELIYRLYRYLVEHQFIAGNVKITVEFLDPETQARAEYMLRTHCMECPPLADPRMIQAICDGQPWQMYGINFQVKRYEYPRRPVMPGCGCPECQRGRQQF